MEIIPTDASMSTKMGIIHGNIFCDDRGYLRSFNELDLSQYKRLYTVENHKAGFIRAWHGHSIANTVVTCLRGAAMIGVMGFSSACTPKMFYLSASNPQAIVIPHFHYNGAKTLSDDCLLLYLSSLAIDEAKDSDDKRLDYLAFGNVWEENYR